MKKQLLVLAVVFVALASNAQQWCLPGATWVYTINATGWTKVNG